MKQIRLIRTPLGGLTAINSAMNALKEVYKKEKPNCSIRRNCSNGVEEMNIDKSFYKNHKFLFVSSGWRTYANM